MFIPFFYILKDVGIPVSPTAFLTLQRAMKIGLVGSIDDFYTASRAILVKSERHFDLFDQVFAHHFEGAELPSTDGLELDAVVQGLLDEWLKDPKEIGRALGIDPEKVAKLSPDALIEYFKERLKDQDERHDGGNRWIGTGGTSPVGHSGVHPEGMRVGGQSKSRSAVKVAGERRYKDYSAQGPLTRAQVGEALKRLRNLVPAGPKDRVNIDATIKRTLNNAGEIEIVFDQSLKDRLKVFLLVDNGGWSMDPYVEMVQTLFDYARSQFKELRTFFFHNTLYDVVWEDPARYRKPVRIPDLLRKDPDTRLVFVGDASMAPYELLSRHGAIHIQHRSGRPSVDVLKDLEETFKRSVWLNPVHESMWGYTHTIGVIRQIVPMYRLSLDGLDAAVTELMRKD